MQQLQQQLKVITQTAMMCWGFLNSQIYGGQQAIASKGTIENFELVMQLLKLITNL